MFNNTSMGGQSLGFPDVCKTPTPAGSVPIPYPNTAEEPLNMPFSSGVFYGCGPAHTVSGKTELSEGDEPGVGMGVASGKDSATEETMLPSMTVFVNGQPVDKMTSPTTHNGNNTIGAKLVPSQVVTMTLT